LEKLMNTSVSGATRLKPALRLVKTLELDREQWLQVRRGGIGSSDAAAAVGLNPYKSMLELWLEKTGRGAPVPESSEQDWGPAYWGTLLEPIVAANYTRQTGNRVRRVNAVLAHPEHPWMLANLDREVVGAGDVQILECKTAGLNGARLWRDGVPEYVQLQVLHQLAVTGKAAADVAVLICGQELRVHRIVRDDTMIGELIELEREFWRLVTEGTAPSADGSESADRALQRLYPEDTGESLMFAGDPYMEQLFQQLLEAKAELEREERRASELKQGIQQRMGDATKAVFSGGSVTWKRSRASTRFDAERLAQEHPELHGQFLAPKPGSRRFVINEKP
jgi:putative phage-type endonuclease